MTAPGPFPVYIALVHHPIVNRNGQVVTTGVTNLDIHDLARTARSYGIAGYDLITPVTSQRALVERIAGHWARGEGRTHHPIRAEALALVRVADSIETSVARIAEAHGRTPEIIGTSARPERVTISYEALRQRWTEAPTAPDGSPPALVLFGTGWGLAEPAMARCDHILPPIAAIPGRDGYNHLSVRSAVAIVCDRLLGARTSRYREKHDEQCHRQD